MLSTGNLLSVSVIGSHTSALASQSSDAALVSNRHDDVGAQVGTAIAAIDDVWAGPEVFRYDWPAIIASQVALTEHGQGADTAAAKWEKFRTPEGTCKHTYGKIDILVIADKGSQRQYEANLDSIACYARLQNYGISIVDPLVDYPECEDTSKDFFFRRICVIKSYLNQTSAEWVMSLDADIAVVNFNKVRFQSHMTALGHASIYAHAYICPKISGYHRMRETDASSAIRA